MKKIWQGLSFFESTNVKGHWTVAAYHHPDSITWRWAFWYSIPNRYSIWRFWFNKRYMGMSYMNFKINIPLLGEFSCGTQQHMWRDDK